MKKILFVAVSFLFSCIAQAQVVIVANKSAPFDALSKEDIVSLYHGRVTKLPNGKLLKALDQSDNATRAEFLKTYLGKSGTQFNTYWSRLTFTGKGLPPENARNDAGVISALQSKPDAVGYIDAKSVSQDVKQIQVTP